MSQVLKALTSLRHRVSQEVLLTLASRISGLMLQFLMGIVIARTLSAAGYGVYSVYTAIFVLVGSLIGIGAPTQSFKAVSQYHGAQQHAKVRAFILKIIGVVGVIGLLALGLAWLGLESGLLDSYQIGKQVLLVGIFASIPFVAVRILFEGMQGIGLAARGMFFENNLIPLLMIGMCGLLSWQLTNVEPQHVIAVNIGCFMILAFLLYHNVTRHAPKKPEKTIVAPVIGTGMLAVWASTMLDAAIIYLPTVLAAQFGSLEEVGKFSIAFRLMLVAVSFLVIIRGLAGRHLILAYAANDMKKCKKIAGQMMLYGLVMYLPLIVIFVFFGRELMYIFGKSFNGGEIYLWILSAGQMVYAVFGMMGFVLIVMDRSRVEAVVAMISVGLLVLMAWLGQSYGVLAVAFAYAAAISIRSLVSYVLVRQRFKLGLTGVKPPEERIA